MLKLENFKLEDLNRIEVINHAENSKSLGRILVLYKELGDFEEVEMSFQDNNKTLKIFLQ